MKAFSERNLLSIEDAKQYMKDKQPEQILESEDFTILFHSEPIANY